LRFTPIKNYDTSDAHFSSGSLLGQFLLTVHVLLPKTILTLRAHEKRSQTVSEGVTVRMLATFIQQVLNGVMLGGSYALVAIGYTLIFGVLNLLHLAHGEVAMIGAYVGFTLVLTAVSQVGILPIWVVLLGAMIGAGIMGIIVELVAFRPLGRRQFLRRLLAMRSWSECWCR